MFARTFLIGALMVSASLPTSAAPSTDARDMLAAARDGTVSVRSAYPMVETVERLKQDIISKGITFFIAIEQSKLVFLPFKARISPCDINTVYPIERLRELAAQGIVGSVAATHYTVMGSTDPSTMEGSADQIRGQLRQERVDAVLLTPV